MHNTDNNISSNEIFEKVPSTAEVLLYKLENSNINLQWINWAIDMLNAGYETENLIILAGEDIHCNPFEFATLTDKIIEELHLNEIDFNSIIINYSVLLAKQVVQSPSKVNITTTLKKLEQRCINNEYPPLLYDFYLLSNAIEELESMGEQWYWYDPSLRKENWFDYTLNYFKHWIENPTPQQREKEKTITIDENNMKINKSRKINIFNRLISLIKKLLK
ncbi:hypothetical protein [Bacteroides sp.]